MSIVKCFSNEFLIRTNPNNLPIVAISCSIAKFITFNAITVVTLEFCSRTITVQLVLTFVWTLWCVLVRSITTLNKNRHILKNQWLFSWQWTTIVRKLLKYLHFSITFGISCDTCSICTSKTVARAGCSYTVFGCFVWSISAVYGTWKWFYLFDKFGPHRLMNIQILTKLPSHWSYELIHCPSSHRHWNVVHCAIDTRFDTRWPVNATTKRIHLKSFVTVMKRRHMTQNTQYSADCCWLY